jgi:predicted transcriptional regulator of viral defense system
MKLQDALNILLDRDARGHYVFRKRDLTIVLDESGRTLDQTLESFESALSLYGEISQIPSTGSLS